METWSRKQLESAGLATISLASILPLRYSVESHRWLFSEITTILACAALVLFVPKPVLDHRALRLLFRAPCVILAIAPAIFALASRYAGSATVFEIVLLSTFGTTAFAVALAAQTARIRSLSVVSSGFLVLFTASISDDHNAAAFPVLWILGCMWHLIANHWERLDLATPEAVQRDWSVKPVALTLTLLVCLAGVYVVRGRYQSSNLLSLGIMPTSGGNKWSDPSARRGVGAGEAAIAAKDHAESFGAVDSDMFLESTESSLFDMASDSLGEPKKPKVWESRQAIGDENVIDLHTESPTSQKGSSSFSTDRSPPMEHQHLSTVTDSTVVQWDGETGIRLAMHRYDQFDGHEWTQSKDPVYQRLVRLDIDNEPWFFLPSMRSIFSYSSDRLSVGLLKVIQLDSTRIPSPMLTAGVRIKDVERADFFGLAEDGSLMMTGRAKIPEMTVIHAVSVGLTEDDIRSDLHPHFHGEHQSFNPLTIKQYVDRWSNDSDAPLDQLNRVIRNLRANFRFARTGESAAQSLDDFLETKKGGDHLFATAAALMARELGFHSRLVTGFYVRPESFDLVAGHSCILPQDIHVWTEIALDDGRWFEVEATPGYQQPRYKPSLLLRCKQFVRAWWELIVVFLVTGFFLQRTHRLWVDWLLGLTWAIARPLHPRLRLRFGMRIIELRARIAGFERPIGKSQRAWLEEMTRADKTLHDAVQLFANTADAMVFGKNASLPTQNATEIVRLLNRKKISAMQKDALT
ncbi:MAG: transglutaminase domain-containing protein [Rubripirellula sp.]|nr:transglutaminase domain-containing protein [Rubripirellula sp.]